MRWEYYGDLFYYKGLSIKESSYRNYKITYYFHELYFDIKHPAFIIINKDLFRHYATFTDLCENCSVKCFNLIKN